MGRAAKYLQVGQYGSPTMPIDGLLARWNEDRGFGFMTPTVGGQDSQMTSCAEATFFLQKCPGTKMDGNNNGIPCERQWC